MDTLINAATAHDPLANTTQAAALPSQLFFVEAASGRALAEIIGEKGAALLGETASGEGEARAREARKMCLARKAAYQDEAPDDDRLTVRGSVSRYLEPDPFSGFYWTQEGEGDGLARADTWPISPVENLSVLSSVYAWSSILPACGNAIARNVEKQGLNEPKETITVDDDMPQGLRAAIKDERRRLDAILLHAFGSEDDWVSALSKCRRDMEGIGMRALEALRTPPPHLPLQTGPETAFDAAASTSGALFGLFGGSSPESSVPAAVTGLKGLLEPAGEPDWSRVDYRGRPYGLRYVEAETLRWCPACAPILSPVWRLTRGDKDDPPRYEKAYETRRWRLIIHERRGQYVYFQQFGDPRIVDSRTGAVIGNYVLGQWPDLDAFPPAVWANELLIDLNHEPTWSPYGAPWWWGDQELVLGLMGAESAIHSGIVNPKIPRVIVSVLGSATAMQIKRQKEVNDKSRENDPGKTNEMLYLEVTPPGDVEMGEDGGSRGKPVSVDQIHVIPEDMYGPFIDRARKNIRGTKGLSNKALGESEDDSFASAESSLIMDDHQVHGPESRRVATWLRQFWQAMRIRYHQVTLRGPKIMSNDQRAAWLKLGKELGADTPERSRRFIARELGEDWGQIAGDWGDQPWGLTEATFRAGPAPGDPGKQGAVPGSRPDQAPAKTRPARTAPAPSSAPAKGGEEPADEEIGRAEKSADDELVTALRALKAALVKRGR